MNIEDDAPPVPTEFAPFRELAGLNKQRILAQSITVVRPDPDAIWPAPLSSGRHAFLQELMCRGTAVVVERKSFDPIELLDTVERERGTMLIWMGDVFAGPAVDALDREPGRWDLSSLTLVFSAGVIFGEASKQALLGHCPQVMIADNLGSAEAPGGGTTMSLRGGVSDAGYVAPVVSSPDMMRYATPEPRSRPMGSESVGNRRDRGH